MQKRLKAPWFYLPHYEKDNIQSEIPIHRKVRETVWTLNERPKLKNYFE